VPYLRVANVQRGYLDLVEIKQIEATEDEIQELRLFPGDILFNEGGDRDKLGRGWIWRGEIPECIHQNHVFRARLYLPELQPKLISWYGNSFGQRYFVSEGKQTTNLASINLTKLGALPIPLPPVEEQRRIVAEIETQFTRLDATETALQRVQANLKRYRASVLQAAYEGRLVPTEAELARAEGRWYEPADQLLQRILQERRAKWEAEQLTNMKIEDKVPKDDRWKSKYREPVKPETSELPKLPEGWVWTNLLAVSELKGGITKGQKRKSSDVLHSVSYLRVANVQRGFLDLREIKQIEATEDEIRELRLLPGDILFNEGGDRDKLGRGWIWRGEIPNCIHQNHVFRARLYIPDIQSKFISWYGNSFGQRYFMSEGKQTTNLASINLTKLGALPIPLPPFPEQYRIVAEVERRLSVIDELEAIMSANLKRVERLRQAILKRAFEGKLAPQDPTDEPASVLLERIRAEREQAMVKPKATPQQIKAPKPTVQPITTAPIQGELALGFTE
jgi:type I restriction enzyme S subunit